MLESFLYFQTKTEKNLQSTLTLQTPRYYGHPDNTDTSLMPGKNKLQTFD